MERQRRLSSKLLGMLSVGAAECTGSLSLWLSSAATLTTSSSDSGFLGLGAGP